MSQIKPEDLEITEWPVCPPGHMRCGMPKGVKITHRKHRMTVICDSERSMHMNREVALVGLQAMINFAETS